VPARPTELIPVDTRRTGLLCDHGLTRRDLVGLKLFSDRPRVNVLSARPLGLLESIGPNDGTSGLAARGATRPLRQGASHGPDYSRPAQSPGGARSSGT